MAAKRILTVDDSTTIRRLLSFTLKQSGFEVTEAEDGVQALEIARNHEFDLVITDLNMPNMNGIQLVAALRHEEAYKAKPIIMLTTESDEAKKAEGKQAGVTGWLIKPFNPEQLLKIINKLTPEQAAA